MGKGEVEHLLVNFMGDIGIPGKLIFMVPKSRQALLFFMSIVRKNYIRWKITEPYMPQHNKDEDEIR